MRRPRPARRPVIARLTTRGRSFLAAGFAASACALGLGQRDLLRVGVLLIVLPLACAVTLARTRFRFSIARNVVPDRVTVGDTVRVRIDLANAGGHRTRALLAQDLAPEALGVSPRFVLSRLPAGGRTAVTYTVTAPLRGRYALGPVRLTTSDPFGMCGFARSVGTADHLLVLPLTWRLGPVPGRGRRIGSGESPTRSAALNGENDITVREYRRGDDVRRVHWRSTARRGELMVRREEQPRRPRATILLDVRADAHRGAGASSSLEWAVSVAGSIALRLVEQRSAVRLITGGGRPLTIDPDGGAASRLLEALALLPAGPPESLSAALTTLLRTPEDGLVVAVLGALDDRATEALARPGDRGAYRVALLARTTAWGPTPSSSASSAAPGRSSAAPGAPEAPVASGGDDATTDAARDRATTALRGAGWAVADAGPADDVPGVWSRAVGLPARTAG